MGREVGKGRGSGEGEGMWRARKVVSPGAHAGSRRAWYYYNGAQAQGYEQFLQVGQLYWALILLCLALFRAPVSLVFMMLYMY